MKSPIKKLAGGLAALLLVATPAIAQTASAWTQIGFSIELDSGTLNVARSPISYTEANASWNNTSTSSSTNDGYAEAFSLPSGAVALDIFDGDNFFLFDAYASTDFVSGATGLAAAAVFAAYDLTFSDVVGSTVTLTLTPLFYSSDLINAGDSFGYASMFLSLGSESFFAYQDSLDNTGLATPAVSYSLTVNANSTVELTGVATAGMQVPDTSATLGLVAFGFVALAGLHRRFGARAVRS